jgi:serine/threonine protein kinase
MIMESPFPYLGKVLDKRYLLNQFLGDGATGYVYRAQAMQISRNFAAKIVDTRRYGKPEFEKELLRRFRMEVEAMSRLRNPHVVAIYEAMQLHEGIFALVMDFVDGRTLQELLERVGRIKMQRTLDIIRQVANGLFEAHTLGFIHRDLKPDNIMIERLPASGFFARILDFGIVHMMDDVTSTQGFRGTPLYASPEQCTGDPGIDHRSDIYSLGCVFFHCLTGQPPFPGTDSLQVMDAHVHDAPPLVSEIIPQSKVPTALDDLLMRLLAKEPADRPDDMSVVIREIDHLLHNPEKFVEPSSGLVEGSTSFAQSQRVETADFPAATLSEASSSGTMQLVRPLIEMQLPELIAETAGSITATSLYRRGTLAAVADKLHRVHAMGLKNDGFFKTFNGATSVVTSVHVDPETNNVLAAELDGTIWQWKLDGNGVNPRKVARLTNRIYAMSTDRLGSRVVCGMENGGVIQVDLRTGKETKLIANGPAISALSVSPTENKALVGYWGGGLEVIDLNTQKRMPLDNMPADPVSIVVSDDGYIAAALDRDSLVRILSLHAGTQFFEITADVANLKALAFAPDSQLMGMSIEDTSILLWEIQSQPAMRAL